MRIVRTICLGFLLVVFCASLSVGAEIPPSSIDDATLITGPQPPSGLGQDLGQPVRVEAGKVTIDVGSLSYAEGSVISIIVKNGLAQVIYSDDRKTACSVVILERWTGDKWVPLLGCTQGRPTSPWAIGPGRGLMISFDPNSMDMLAASRSGPLGKGSYHAKFMYRPTFQRDRPDPFVVYSQIFQIGP